MTNVGNDWVQLAYWENSTGYGSYVSQLRLIAWSSQDVANNRSTIHFKWQKSITGGSAYWADSHTYTVSFGGKSLSWSFAFGNVSSTSWVDCAGEQTMLVGHNDQGVLSGNFSCTGYKMWEYVEGSGNITCPTIPRASVPSINTWPSSTPEFTLGNTITVHMNRKSSSFTHTVYFKYGNTSKRLGADKGVTNNVSFNTSEVEDEILALIPTSKSYSNVVEVTTYNGTTPIGTKTCAYTAKVNTAVEHPTVGTITIQDTNERTSSVTQDDSVYIANISTLKATINFGVAGSHTILNEATVTCGSVTQNFILNGTSDSIEFVCDRVNASSLTVTVKDQRGTTATGSKSWTLIAYQPVTATATVGRPSATGSVGVGQVTGMAYGGSFGATQNSLTILVDFKMYDDADYDTQDTETYTLALSQSGYNSWTDALTFNYTFDYQYQYNIRFTVSDLFSTAVYTAQLMQGLPILSWDETEVDVFGDLHIHDRTDPFKYQNVMDGFDALMAHGSQQNLAVFNPQTTTVQGITYHVYATGAVSVVGTATAYSSLNIGVFTAVDGDTYILSGCPSGGGQHTFSVGVDSTHDFGEGAVITGNGKKNIYIDVFAGETVNLAMYISVRDSRIAASEFAMPLFLVRSFTSPSVSLAASNSTSTTITIAVPDGYRILAILRTWSNGNIFIHYISTTTLSAQWSQNGNNASVTAWVRNPTSSTSSVTISAEVLFIRA